MSRKHPSQGPDRDARRRPPNPRHEDNYPHAEKARKSRVCTECGLVLHAGRWHRDAPPAGEVDATLCPACTRIRDGYAAGRLRLDAGFALHRDEIVRMIRNEEEAETAEHPLERLMGIEDVEGGIVVTTTGIHLARRIANKLERRFHRQARFHYADDDQLLQVEWERE